jgi:hypothetical protein
MCTGSTHPKACTPAQAERTHLGVIMVASVAGQLTQTAIGYVKAKELSAGLQVGHFPGAGCFSTQPCS